MLHHEPVAKALCKLVMKHVKPLAGALYPRGVAAKSILDEEVCAHPDASSGGLLYLCALQNWKLKQKYGVASRTALNGG